MTGVELDAAADEVAEEAAAHAADVDRTARFPAEAVEALRRTGLLGLTVGAELGGWGEGPAAASRLITGVARRCPSTGMILTMHLAAVATLARAGAEEVLGDVAAGAHLSTLALSEPTTRSSFWIATSRLAERTDGRLEVDADKSFVTSAGPADSYVVTLASPGRDSDLTSDVVLVRAEDGAEVLDWWTGSGLRGNASAPMRFRAVLAADARLVPPAQGLTALIDTILPWFLLGAAAVSVGLCRGAQDGIREHLRTTELAHLGQRLIDQPVVRHSLGHLAVETTGAEATLTSTAEAMQAEQADLEALLALKATVNETALAVTDKAMRLGGGAAYAGRTPVDRFFRDARAGVVMAPTPDAVYDMIGRSLAGQPLF